MGTLKKLFSRMAGKAAKAKAAVEGNVGVLSSIAGDHAEIETLMQGVSAAAASSDPKALDTRRRLFRKLRIALLVHQRAESLSVYEVLDQAKLEHARMVHSSKEHEEIDGRLAHLHGLAADDAEWASHFAELMAAVQCHHDMEEHEVFADARRLLDQVELERMDVAFKAAREKILETLQGQKPVRPKTAVTRRIVAPRAP